MMNFFRRLFGRKANAPIERCSVEELRNVKQEADYLASAVDATRGELTPEDTERLKRFKETLDKINQRTQ